MILHEYNSEPPKPQNFLARIPYGWRSPAIAVNFRGEPFPPQDDDRKVPMIEAPQSIHDVFICHASEDKDDFVRPLAHALREEYLDVWCDEFSLTVGDSLRATIDRGLATSRFGIVVLSPSFFKKSWALRELSGLVARETDEGRPLVLPIWHGVTREEILTFSPPLADAVAITSDKGVSHVVRELLRKLRPDPSPLVVARDFLLENGIAAPGVTDEWWLHLIGIKNSQFDSPDAHFSRWMFPLPYKNNSSSRELGLDLAWTSLQLDWIHEAEKRRICQLTHPEEVHDFLNRWPGLVETARVNPGNLAMYVPQITILGNDAGFTDVFDALLDPNRKDAYQMPGYGPTETTDGNRPLCGELIAWRHPTFGNYADRELGYTFVDAHNGSYSRRLPDKLECLIWLLCDASNWMPEQLKSRLIRGVALYYSRADDLFGWGSPLGKALRGPPSKFRFTRTVKASIREIVGGSLEKLQISQDVDAVVERFMESEIVASVYRERRELEETRRRK